MPAILDTMTISIHAPLRERPLTSTDVKVVSSTLPYGSDYEAPACPFDTDDFNPRSLTGATRSCCFDSCPLPISIHAPSRERRDVALRYIYDPLFQSTLPRGSDGISYYIRREIRISIHAPSRERLDIYAEQCTPTYFNPRSLAGATSHNITHFLLHAFQSTLPRGSDFTVFMTVRAN